MPSMGDSIVIFLLALMLFGPKKLPQLARQLGKLMAEFRKASNDFRMQMEDELRLEEQKEHQAKVDALAPPPSALPNPDIPTEDPPHPHTPAAQSEAAEKPAPIAESGELKMMPPASGLPLESAARGTSFAPEAFAGHQEAPALPSSVEIPEHSIGAGVGMSSEEPVAETVPPDRTPPAMLGGPERATHA